MAAGQKMNAATSPRGDNHEELRGFKLPAASGSSQQLPFFLLTMMLAMFVLRPWDTFPALAVVRPMMLVTCLTILTFIMGQPRIEFWNVRPAKWMVAFWCAIVFSMLFSYWPSQSLSIATDYLKQIALFILIVNLITTPGRLKTFVSVFVAACAWHGAAAVVDFSSGTGERLTGIAEPYFGDPNDLALSLVMVLPLAWWLSSVVISQWARFTVYASMLIFVAGIVATQSRGGLLALIAAVGVMVIWQGREKLGTLLLTLAAAVVFSVIFLPAEAFERYSTITQYHKDESAMSRLAVWKAGAAMCADHPLTGVGAGTFDTVYGKWYIDRKAAGNVWRTAHSSYVEVAAELGIIGFVIFLGILASTVQSLFQSQQLLNQLARVDVGYSYEPATQLLKLNSALQASVCGFLVGGAFLSRGYDMVFMIVIALVAVSWRCTLAVINSAQDLSG